MIGENVLLFPDSGPEFIRSLRMSSLYAERSYALTVFDSDVAQHISSVCHALEVAARQAGDENILVLQRLLDYGTFIQEHHRDFSLLLSEGVLERCIEGSLDELFGEAQDFAGEQLVQRLQVSVVNRDLPDADSDNPLTPLMVAHNACPASFYDLLHLLHIVKTDSPDPHYVEAEVMPDWQQKLIHYCAFLVYILSLVYVSEKAKMALLSWSNDYHIAVHRFRELFIVSEAFADSSLTMRKEAEVQVARAVIERHLPTVDDLPFEEILKIRQKRSAELQAFRSGLAELATQIDITQSAASLDLQVHDLVVAKVDPAIRELQSAVHSSRIDALAKIGQNYSSLAAATIPATLAYSAGAPINVSALVAALGAVAGALIDSSAQQSKIVNANQWSLVFNLTKKIK